MKGERLFTCGQASRQQPQVMQRDSGYAACWSSCDILGPGPAPYVMSTGIQACTFLKLTNRELRSTTRSRTTGNFVNGSMTTGSFRPSTRVLHACLGMPLMVIAHAPQTSSRQEHSHATGVVFLPSLVTGFFCMSIRAMMTFIPGRN